MDFRIADTFSDSLIKLTNQEQTAVKSTVFDLQINPANPSFSFHKLDKVKDKNFWSVRVNQDVRIILHRTDLSLLLCYVDHHDKAYAWAERRKLEVHPQTGAAQMVEIRETVKEVIIPKYVEVEVDAPAKPIFHYRSDDELLGYGVPTEWLSDVRDVRTDDDLLILVDHLPKEAADALLIIADGGTPPKVETVEAVIDPFSHPDAMRRFRVMNNVEELQQALNYPWEKWTVFLHPVQRELATKDYTGPARVTGTAGTGKTIVALHRAVHLARNNPGSRILLATFSNTLANALKSKLKILLTAEPRLAEQIEVYSLTSISRRLFELKFGKLQIAEREEIIGMLKSASEAVPENKFPMRFIIAEWDQIVDDWQLKTWEDYRDVNRLGRKTGLSENQRALLWTIFEKVLAEIRERNLITDAGIYGALAEDLTQNKNQPFDFAVIDEAQDINPSQLKFLAALGGGHPNSLFFAGDLGQRIFQLAFSWLSVGVDVRGRSRSLKINYRTSHQIRSQADRLLEPEISDVDGVKEERKGTISIFNGPDPQIEIFDTQEDEIGYVSEWLKDLGQKGFKPQEIAIFVRSNKEMPRAISVLEKANLLYKVLDSNVDTAYAHVSVGTMHLAKGLEFRAVVVMACDDEVIPSQSRIEEVGDNADLIEVYNTERQLLYVACTRARDYLLVTAAENASEFLDDLKM